MNHYFLNIKSEKKELDLTWYTNSISFKTEITISLNDKVSFDSKHKSWQLELTNDYGTRLFKVIDKIIRVEYITFADLLSDPFIDLILEPIYLEPFN